MDLKSSGEATSGTYCWILLSSSGEEEQDWLILRRGRERVSMYSCGCASQCLDITTCHWWAVGSNSNGLSFRYGNFNWMTWTLVTKMCIFHWLSKLWVEHVEHKHSRHGSPNSSPQMLTQLCLFLWHGNFVEPSFRLGEQRGVLAGRQERIVSFLSQLGEGRQKRAICHLWWKKMN